MHPIEPFAREAFAAGWAASGGPLTGRVRAACATAVALAVENADDPGILRATVDLGRLEGMWALLFQRREALQAAHAAAVQAAWRRLLTPARVAATARAFRQQMGLGETRRPDSDREREVQAAALAAALAMLHTFADEPGWTDLQDALEDAIRAGTAEGMVAAVAIAADEADAAGLDWDTGFQHAYDALDRLDAAAGTATRWLKTLIDRAAAALARILTGEAADDADAEDAAQAAQDAADFVVDWAMTTAAAAGALSLYQAHSNRVSVITVGDNRVCQACADAETGSPWALDEAPQLPLHPSCRCSYAGALDLSAFAAWFT